MKIDRTVKFISRHECDHNNYVKEDMCYRCGTSAHLVEEDIIERRITFKKREKEIEQDIIEHRIALKKKEKEVEEDHEVFSCKVKSVKLMQEWIRRVIERTKPDERRRHTIEFDVIDGCFLHHKGLNELFFIGE